jgi:hypothetical protein
MQSPASIQKQEATSFATPHALTEPLAMSQSPSPPTSSSAKAVDPLVAQTAQRIAAAINDFKRQLDLRDGTWAVVTGNLEFGLRSQDFHVVFQPDKDGHEYPITFQVIPKPHDATNSESSTSHRALAAYEPTRRASDAELGRDLISRNKRKFESEQHGHNANKRSRTEEDHDAIRPTNKENLADMLDKLRDDVQDDTSECVNHVHRLLRRFKEEWHEKNQCDYEHTQLPSTRPPFRDSIANGPTTRLSFPSPSLDRDSQYTPVPDLIRREAKLLSHQIKWVEDCRKVGAELHDKREETWRTSSAGFHDLQRQNREAFQNKLLQETGTQTQTLSHLLERVEAIGIHIQSMKWETPASHLSYPAPSIHTPPAFSIPRASTARTPVGRGGSRGQMPTRAPPPPT